MGICESSSSEKLGTAVPDPAVSSRHRPEHSCLRRRPHVFLFPLDPSRQEGGLFRHLSHHGFFLDFFRAAPAARCVAGLAVYEAEHHPQRHRCDHQADAHHLHPPLLPLVARLVLFRLLQLFHALPHVLVCVVHFFLDALQRLRLLVDQGGQVEEELVQLDDALLELEHGVRLLLQQVELLAHLLARVPAAALLLVADHGLHHLRVAVHNLRHLVRGSLRVQCLQRNVHPVFRFFFEHALRGEHLFHGFLKFTGGRLGDRRRVLPLLRRHGLLLAPGFWLQQLLQIVQAVLHLAAVLVALVHVLLKLANLSRLVFFGEGAL
mmetsp:Transcript_5044/g.12740  ORF Transcript_5044/g.12740 Transcript_5044/m.12740 type:complete len:321 (+) Transcript_5044:622-1584(+)